MGAGQAVGVRACPADGERRLQLTKAFDWHTIAASCKTQEPAGCEQAILWGTRVFSSSPRNSKPQCMSEQLQLQVLWMVQEQEAPALLFPAEGLKHLPEPPHGLHTEGDASALTCSGAAQSAMCGPPCLR